MSGAQQQEMMAQMQAQRQAPGAAGGGMQPQMQQAPGAGGGGMGIQPVPMGLQVDPAYGQQPQFAMQGQLPQRNRMHAMGPQMQPGGLLQMDPAYGQQQMPAMGSRPAPIGRIRSR